MQTRQYVMIFAVILSIVAGADAQQVEAENAGHPGANEQKALDVVARRIAGYNSHDIDAFLSAHAERVQIYEFPERKIGEGRAHLKRIFGPQLDRGIGHVEVLGQFVVGNRVVSHENVTVENVVERLVTVYTVENGVITSLRLIESDE